MTVMVNECASSDFKKQGLGMSGVATWLTSS